ncbi:MAG: hypothetical protein ABMA13_21750 [Chthoniobacteraceae bacterium]
MRILFLNQYFPPDPAPTGVLFAEIAGALRGRGHEPVFVEAAQVYREGQGRGARLLRELLGLVRIIWRGIFCRKSDVVVSGTSPPCLAVVAALVALRHRAPHLHWAMDLYPDLAIALREVKPGLLVGTIRFMARLACRCARAVVALDADMAAVLRSARIHPLECRPWVSASVLVQIPAVAPRPMEPWTWLYSGNLGRAHDWQTLLAAQAALEERGVDATLVFQGGGPAREAAVARAEELKLRRVVWRPYAPEADLAASLLRAQCLVVTQLPETRGLLWPSKLALLLGLPRPVLFVGPRDGAIATLLRARSGAATGSTGDFRAVADWIQRLRTDAPANPEQELIDITAHRRGALAWWVDLIEASARR